MQCIPTPRWLACVAAFAGLGLGCAADSAPGSRPELDPTVILISLDGTRPADASDPGLAHFAEIARRGARAERLTPVFPTKTFPNHVSLVTGVRPSLHGIVSNVFLDPERGLFRYGDDPTWLEVEPIWSWCARHGVVSASYYWVGSEGEWTNGLGPRHWRRFDTKTGEREKVAQILEWLDLPDAAQRPRLVTAWFHGADSSGHRHGPGSEAVKRAMRQQDAALGELLRGLEARRLLDRVTLLLVSDHGMAPVERHVDLRAAFEEAGLGVRLLGGGGFALLVDEEGRDVDAAVRRARELGLSAWKRGEAPPELDIAHRRFGAAVVLAPPGTAVGSSSQRGSHGYRPEHPEMGALFMALGRGVAAGTQLGTLHSLDVAPTVLALLGVPIPEWMEGRPLAALLPEGALP